MTEGTDLPLSEHLRPRILQELTLPDRHIERMQGMLEARSPANMLFFGRPGTGKTSAARIFLGARGVEGTLIVDGSNETGVDYVRKLVDGFASCYAFTPGLKLCFIDDADYLSKPAQASLRGVIERSYSNCRFIFAVNEVNKIDLALRSRLLPISFAVANTDRPTILARMQERLSERLTQLGYSFSREWLNQMVADHLSDLRSMANKIEFNLGARVARSI
jgi:DNA polymerase III delta prime subunit